MDQVFSVSPNNELLVHTNHFISAGAKTIDRGKVPWGGRSRFRLKQVRALLEPRIGQLSLEDIKNALADHTQYPNSVCSHRTEDGDVGGTLNSYWMDLTEGIFCIANGPPCTTPFTEIPLRDLGFQLNREG